MRKLKGPIKRCAQGWIPSKWQNWASLLFSYIVYLYSFGFLDSLQANLESLSTVITHLKFQSWTAYWRVFMSDLKFVMSQTKPLMLSLTFFPLISDLKPLGHLTAPFVFSSITHLLFCPLQFLSHLSLPLFFLITLLDRTPIVPFFFF